MLQNEVMSAQGICPPPSDSDATAEQKREERERGMIKGNCPDK